MLGAVDTVTTIPVSNWCKEQLTLTNSPVSNWCKEQLTLTNKSLSIWCGGEDPAAALENPKPEKRLLKKH